MTYLQAFILGIIQGITEFLPISSSGHLVIVPYLLGWNIPEEQVFPFDVLVQFSTLFAVLIYYRNEIIQIARAMISGLGEKKPFGTIESRVGWLTVLATIPAGLAGLLLKDVISDAFSNPQLAAGSLLITAALLYFSEKRGQKTRKLDQLNWIDAIVMGIAQAFAVFPGISRSGSTISGGMLRNLDRKTSGQFAFLMAIPIMTAAGAISLIDLMSMPDLDGFFNTMIIGFITSGVVGFFSIKWLLKYISNHDLTPFAIYCAVIGIGTLAITFYPSITTFQPQAIENPTPLTVAYQPAASWMVPVMQSCADTVFEIGILLEERSDFTEIPDDATLFITYGELNESSALVYQIGADAIVLAASINSPIDVLPLTYQQKVLSGDISDFKSLGSSCPSCMKNIKATSKIKTWVNPKNSAFSALIQKTYQFQFSSSSLIAPTPALLAQSLKSDPASIGMLPGKMVDEDLKILSDNYGSEVAILVHLRDNPQENTQKWLVCLLHEISG